MTDFFQVLRRTRLPIIPIVTLPKIFQNFHPLQFTYSKPSFYFYLEFVLILQSTRFPSRLLLGPHLWQLSYPSCVICPNLELHFLCGDDTIFVRNSSWFGFRHVELKPFCDITLASDQLLRQHSVSKQGLCTRSIISDVLVVRCSATGFSTRVSITLALIFCWNRRILFEWPPS